MLVSSMMMNLLFSKPRRTGGSRTALLVGLATLIGVPLALASPVSAAAPTAEIAATAEVGSTPWVDAVRYTIGVEEDQPFWLYTVDGNDLVLVNEALDQEGRYSPANWVGLYFEPVDATKIASGETDWVLRGTLSSWNVSILVPMYLAFSNGLVDLNSTDLSKSSRTVSFEQPSDGPGLVSATLGRDLASIEVVFNQALLEQDVEWGGTTYSATPPVGQVNIWDGVSQTLPSSLEIDGQMMVVRFASGLSEEVRNSAGVDLKLAVCQFGCVNAGPFNNGLVKRHFSNQLVDGPSTSPPALDPETPPSISEDGTSLTLTFDYSITTAVPDVGVLAVDSDGGAVAVSTITNNGATSVLTLASAVSQGATVTVSYTKPGSGGLQDAAGNEVVTFTNQAVTNNSTVDGTAPQLASGTAPSLASDGTSLTLTFDEALAAASETVKSAFTVTAGGATVAVSGVANSGATSVLTLASAVAQGAAVTVSYDAPDSGGFQDAAGNLVVDFTDVAVTNNSTQVADVTAPRLASGTAPALASNGTALTLTFDEALAADVPATSAFTVTAGGSSVAVSGVANSGATSVLTLASAVAQGATVTVAYTQPESGGLQDAAGNEVVTFTAQAVTNNSDQAAESGESAESGEQGETTSTEPATTEPETVSTTPTLVTEENQAALTATPGSGKMMVNGEEVELTLTSTGADDASGSVAPEERTAEQVSELQEAADGLIERLDTAAGGDSGLEVVDTDTGAEIDGLFNDTNVPIEDVIVAEASEFTGVYASRDEDGNPNTIRAEILEMERGDEVVVYVYGLPPNEEAELVLMSTPYLLGTVTADAAGNFSRVLSAPESILAGDHTLVTASETLTVSLGIRITDPAATDAAAEVELPATGRDLPFTLGLVIVGLGALLLVASRRREWVGN